MDIIRTGRNFAATSYISCQLLDIMSMLFLTKTGNRDQRYNVFPALPIQ